MAIRMRPLEEFETEARRRVRFVLTDIDDTITTDGRLPAASYAAIERLDAAGLLVVPVTGRPAGWCDLIARMWPVAGVVGENGALAFRYDRTARRMDRIWWKSETERAADRARLEALRLRILSEVPGSAVAADQAYREADLAIDFCEDVAPLDESAIDRIVALFEAAGAVAKVSSIHVNGWYGAYDKLTMARRFLADSFDADIDAENAGFVFAGDSPNDAPMFAHFINSVGVANVRETIDRIATPPAYVTTAAGGKGFAELAEKLLAVR